jgi:hypothetical protein
MTSIEHWSHLRETQGAYHRCRGIASEADELCTRARALVYRLPEAPLLRRNGLQPAGFLYTPRPLEATSAYSLRRGVRPPRVVRREHERGERAAYWSRAFRCAQLSQHIPMGGYLAVHSAPSYV